ncbi:MAG: hypothetical protein K0S26_938 [Bacteroidota bacterium]|jgi:hypothetical protein|nr:hypothetical protein [Bacteroidota bacterium]
MRNVLKNLKQNLAIHFRPFISLIRRKHRPHGTLRKSVFNIINYLMHASAYVGNSAAGFGKRV